VNVAATPSPAIRTTISPKYHRSIGR
jgi:hypothetical protein